MCGIVRSLETIPVDTANNILRPVGCQDLRATGGPARTATTGASGSCRDGSRCGCRRWCRCSYPAGLSASDKLTIEIERYIAPGSIACLCRAPGVVISLIIVAPVAFREAYLDIAAIAIDSNAARCAGESNLKIGIGCAGLTGHRRKRSCHISTTGCGIVTKKILGLRAVLSIPVANC